MFAGNEGGPRTDRLPRRSRKDGQSQFIFSGLGLFLFSFLFCFRRAFFVSFFPPFLKVFFFLIQFLNMWTCNTPGIHINTKLIGTDYNYNGVKEKTNCKDKNI